MNITEKINGNERNSILGDLNPGERKILQEHLTTRIFDAGQCIFRQGDTGDGCFIIKQGKVRVELHETGESQHKLLGYIGEGRLVGEMSLSGISHRSASVFADTDVVLHWLSLDKYHQLEKSNPSVALALSKSINRDMAEKLQRMNYRLICHLSS